MSKRKCCVGSCTEQEHSRGYCRKHYGRLWRGRELEPEKKPEEKVVDVADAEQELMQMRKLYDHVCGLEGRMRWSRRIRECEQFVRREQERMGRRVMTATG